MTDRPDPIALQRELDSVWAVIREVLPEAIGSNTLPEIVAGIAAQRDSQRELKDHLVDTARRLTERIAEYEHRISWNTTCGNCAHLLDVSIAEHERADAAQAQLAEARAWLAKAEPYPDLNGNHFAPQPELETPDRKPMVRCIYTAYGWHRPGMCCAATPEPPASDEPARCEHGKVERHVYPESMVGRHPAYCPGPAASGTLSTQLKEI